MARQLLWRNLKTAIRKLCVCCWSLGLTGTWPNTGVTALMAAFQNGHLEAVRLLLESGAAKDLAKRTGATMFFMASQQGHLEIARLLLESRAEKDLATNKGATALMVASQNGHLDVVRLLLESGADKD